MMNHVPLLRVMIRDQGGALSNLKAKVENHHIAEGVMKQTVKWVTNLVPQEHHWLQKGIQADSQFGPMVMDSTAQESTKKLT